MKRLILLVSVIGLGIIGGCAKDKPAAIAPPPEQPPRQVMRQVDGRVVEVAKNNVVYISLGTGDRIVNGMTFEVFDKNEGPPRSNDGLLPPGKASIEVLRVSPGSSECKVVRVAPGERVSNGDLLANAIYDSKTNIRFHVYGEFDLDQNGNANVNETEHIKRLITQWGGMVVDQINVDTDFVVMGKEPVLPPKPPQGDLIAEQEYKQALQKWEAYHEVRDRALRLNIPVMGQDRFLVYVGYYDQAKK